MVTGKLPTIRTVATPLPREGGISRRTVVGAAAWAVPVMSMTAAVPAWAAASDATQVSVSVTNNQLPASGTKSVVVTVRDHLGTPLAGRAVNLMGPDGSAIALPNGTTDGAGQFSTTIDLATPWAPPGRTVTLTALSDGAVGSLPVSVLGSNLLVPVSGVLSQSPPVFPSPVVDYAPLWGMAVLADGSVWHNAPNWERRTDVSDAARLSTSNSGPDTVYVLKKDGTVVCWGVNGDGQLGDGTTNDRATPGLFQGLENVAQVSAAQWGVHAVKKDGTLWFQGRNTLGRGGVDSTAAIVPLTEVPLAGGAVQVTNWVGLSAGAVAKDGTVWTWGQNTEGELADGTTTQQNAPVKVIGLSGITALTGACAYGDFYGGHFLALKNDGTVWTWGRNTDGQLGYGGTTISAVATQVPGVGDVAQIATSPGASYALKTDGTLLAWGRTSLSIGTVSTPTAVPVSRPITTLLGIHGHRYGDGCSTITT